MAQSYEKKRHQQHNIVYTLMTVLLLSAVFLAVAHYFYSKAEDEAYEQLHIQTNQIKSDLELQLISDQENLITMANFAAKLYADGESYDRMFQSFNPIGLIANIGILTPEGNVVTKMGSVYIGDAISFEEEAKKGIYISDRTKDVTNDKLEIIRSAVPIKVNEEIVGILYGVIRLDALNERYGKMAEEINAQLFVYDKYSGNFIIDTIHSYPQNISILEDRKFKDGYTYDLLLATDCGYITFESKYTDEDMYAHYSPLEGITSWQIMLARADSYVFSDAHIITQNVLIALVTMAVIMLLYILFVMRNERNSRAITTYASNIRKLLLDINQQHNNINEALKNILLFAKSRSAFFVDVDGKDYNYSLPSAISKILKGDDRKYFVSQLFRYASELHITNKTEVNVVSIIPDSHLENTNPEFYEFLLKNKIENVTFASVINNHNHIGLIGTVNPQKEYMARILLEEIIVCFSIAIYNKAHLDKTEIAVATDSLTGVANRVSYNKDIHQFDLEKPENFCCIYIDVNELHLVNNKYGHASGDEMLIYIANTLKDIFFDHKVYRMGGDEFLVYTEDESFDTVKKEIQLFVDQLAKKNYHVAIGTSYRSQNINTEEMVREAEVRMYDAKAEYYQNKELQKAKKAEETEYIQTRTGIAEIDAMISMLKEHYNGIYRVSLATDKAHRILMPAYLGYNETEDHFSEIFAKYVDESVSPDYHRAMTSFLNYETLKRQLAEGNQPRITYKKINGDTVILTIYKLGSADEPVNNALWVFAKG